MQVLRQFGTSLVLAVVSLGLVIGGLSLSIGESYTPPPQTPTQSLPTAPVFLTITSTSENQVPFTATFLPTSTNTAALPPSCMPPAGWIAIVVQSTDTLGSIASRYQITVGQLTQANCLLTQSLIPGTILYVPPIPTHTPIPCGPPRGWIAYTVQPGDTLFHIAYNFGITTYELQRANCLGYSTFIRVGQSLWVPNVPTRTPGVTIIPQFPTDTPVPTEPLTLTPLPFTQTIQPSNTPEPPTNTPIPPSGTSTSTQAPPSPTITAFPTQ